MTDTDEWDDVVDVVIVGSGAGAMTGALAATANGLRTVVLEKTPVVGGTSAYSGAAVWLPGSRVQRRADIDDSTESARTYLRELLGEHQRERREAFLTTAPEVVDFLEGHPSLEFRWQAFPDYFDVPGRRDLGRSLTPLDLPIEHLGDLRSLVRPPVERDRKGQSHPDAPLSAGRALIGRLLLAFTSTGNGTIHTGSCVSRLIVDDGALCGVEAQTAEGPVRVRATRGVLLAAGGFETNAAMREQHHVPGAAEWTMAPRGTNSGEPLRAAIAVGAATELMDQAWWCPGLEQVDGTAAFTLGLRGGLLVDSSGRRFANESLPYDRMGRVMQVKADRVPAHLIFDSRFGGHLPAIALPGIQAEDHLQAGTWAQADSVTELAQQLDLPSEVLESTCARFNGFAAGGVDHDFHRGEDPYDLFFADRSHSPNPCLVPVDRPPYYAARIVLGDLGTKGGLRTDQDGRVLRGDGQAIPGLYAAGNTSASFTGRLYPGPGIPIGSAMVFSYRAITDMARVRTWGGPTRASPP